MDFTLPPDIVDLCARVRGFIEREIMPLEQDRANYDQYDNIRIELCDAMRERARKAGLYAPQMPRERGACVAHQHLRETAAEVLVQRQGELGLHAVALHDHHERLKAVEGCAHRLGLDAAFQCLGADACQPVRERLWRLNRLSRRGRRLLWPRQCR